MAFMHLLRLSRYQLQRPVRSMTASERDPIAGGAQMNRRRRRTASITSKSADHIQNAQVPIVSDEHAQCNDRDFPATRATQLQKAMRPVGDNMARGELRRVHSVHLAQNKKGTRKSVNRYGWSFRVLITEVALRQSLAGRP